MGGRVRAAEVGLVPRAPAVREGYLRGGGKVVLDAESRGRIVLGRDGYWDR